jgi:hypothetical protein
MNPPGSELDEEPFVVNSPLRDKDGEADDDEDTSDDEDDEQVSVKKKFEEITRGLKENKLDLRDAATLEKFATHNASYLGQKTAGDSDGNTLLHLLVEDAKDKVIDKYQPLVKLLIDRHPDLLREKDADEKTALYVAISKKRDKLVRFICDTHPEIDAILSIPCSRSENCLHVAIRRNVAPKLAVFLIEHASEETLCAKEDKGNTPLHLAVDYERCTDVQFEIVQALILRCDKAMDERTHMPNSFSPYRYHEHTHVEAKRAAEAEAKKAAKEKEKETAQGKKDDGSATGGDGRGDSAGGKDGVAAKFKVVTQAKDAKAPKPPTGPKGLGGASLGMEVGKIEPLRRLNMGSEAPLGKYGSDPGPYGWSGGAGNAGYKNAGVGLGIRRAAEDCAKCPYGSRGGGEQ